jgi:hypothetical protein
MTEQPSFNTPAEAIGLIGTCLRQNDTAGLYTAFTQETSDFWKDILFQHLREIEAAETLECVFLEGGKITSFPEQETVLHLGGHSLLTHHIHIKLVKIASGWVLDSIHVCR